MTEYRPDGRTGVDIIRRIYAAANARDVEGVLVCLADDIEWIPQTAGFYGTFSGHAGVRQYFRGWLEAVEENLVEPERFIENGDRVFVVVMRRIKSRMAGIEVERRVAHVWTLRGDRVSRFETFTDVEAALREIGAHD